MREVDRQTYTALGISEYALMCQAGAAAVPVVLAGETAVVAAAEAHGAVASHPQS